MLTTARASTMLSNGLINRFIMVERNSVEAISKPFLVMSYTTGLMFWPANKAVSPTPSVLEQTLSVDMKTNHTDRIWGDLVPAN